MFVVVIFFFLLISTEASANMVIVPLWPLHEAKVEKIAEKCYSNQVIIKSAVREYIDKEYKNYNYNEFLDLYDYNGTVIIKDLCMTGYLPKHFGYINCKFAFSKEDDGTLYCEYHGSNDGKIRPSTKYNKDRQKDLLLYYIVNYGFIIGIIIGIILCFKKEKKK